MSSIIQTFLGNVMAAVLIWLLFCAILVGAFAREKSGRFLVGMLRVIASVIYSPFVFLRNAILGVIRFADGEADFAGSDQYLLNKLMLTLQALVIVIAVASLAAGGVMTWNALVPPQWTRDRVRSVSADLETTNNKAAEIATAVTKADADWQSSKTQSMHDYVAKWQKIVDAKKSLNAQLSPLINSASPNAAAIMNNVVSLAGSSVADPAETSRRAERMDSYVRSYYWYIDDMTRGRLFAWIANWREQQAAQFRAWNATEAAVRADVQPEYERLTSQKAEIASRVTSLENDLAAANAEAALRWKDALWAVLRALMSFVVLVWMLGIVVEGAWMVIRMAGDVRRIREKATEAPAEEQAGDAAPGVRDQLPVAS